MVKPGFLEHCLFVWILPLCSTAEKSIPSVLLRALKCPQPLEAQVQFTGTGDSLSSLCFPELGLGFPALPQAPALGCWGRGTLAH